MIRTSVVLAGILIAVLPRLTAQTVPSSFEFIENKGQWNNTVKYKGELTSGAFYLQSNGFTIALHHPKDLASFMGNHSSAHKTANKKNKNIDYSRDLSGKVTDNNLSNQGAIVRSHAYSVEFTGSNTNPQIVPDKLVPSYNNYIIGRDKSRWVQHARIFQAVVYKNIYPNIDIRYYSENDKLKYDLIINPGGDPSKIVMKYTGADKLSIKNNELIIKTSVGDIRELYPYSFQPDNVKGRKQIDCKYVLGANSTVKFQLGPYSKNTTLVIDPSLIFVSFTGSPVNQYGFTATPGPDGSLFSGGIVFGDKFPTSVGAYQQNYQGGTDNSLGTDIGIFKFSPNGSQKVYATYLGGNNNEYPHSLFSDPQGNLVVMGRTYSDDYPGAKYGPCGGGDIIVSKLNAAGSNLIGSLIIGGSKLDGVNIEDVQQSHNFANTTLIRNYGDDSRSEVILDPSNNIYIAAQSQSEDFKTTAGAFQMIKSGKQDGVVLKIDPSCNTVFWSSFLGGEGEDGAFVIDINPMTNNIYVGGGTTTGSSADLGILPRVGAGPTGAAFSGGQTDAFVSMISNNGSSLIKTIYLGTANADIIYGLKFDRLGFPYVMGVSAGGTWPVTANATYKVAGSSQFVAKLTQDLSAFVYSTVFGSGSPKPNMSPVAFLVDRCENVYISGWGGWISTTNADPFDQAGVVGMPITADAIKKTTDNQDFYFIVIQKNAFRLLYGTFFGQTGGQTGEHVDGGTSRFDQQGVIYQAICANCGGGARFPTTPGVVGPVNGSDACNLAAVKMAFNFAGVTAGPRPTVNGIRDSLGCLPFTVTLQDTIRNAISYLWSFGDGTPDSATTNFEVSHTFNTLGTFKIRLIAIDTNSCNVRDTAYTYVTVGQDKANLAIDIQKLDPCEQLNYQFNNNSSTSGGAKPFTDSSFVWDFGDGSQLVYSGPGPIVRAYPQPGTYNVKLYLVDPGYCNSPDSLVQQVFVNPLVDARFETPLIGCAPYTAQFTNTSLAGSTFEWNFGDGGTSTDVNPAHLFVDPGTYNVTLIARDPGTCNKQDDTTISITVANKPTAEFSFTPVVPVQNKPTIFNNLSTGGVRYKWLFGDGDSVIKNTRDTVLHQYNESGTYNACLITFNEFECTDTTCHDVQADVLPLIDVPNAFTPGKFGRNSVIRVEGFGIARLSWKIYNRWGHIVFETNDRRGAWDGTFRGQSQPVDVYQYTLEVQFVDGAKSRRTGDITLIR